MNRVAVVNRLISRSMAKDAILVTASIALIAIAAQISVPLWPVPVTLSTFAVMVIAATMSTAKSTVSVLGYLTAGALGLPVFAGALSLSAVRPTFGYLVGFAIAAFIISYLVSKGSGPSVSRLAAVFVLATAVIYTLGAGWLVVGFGMSPYEALIAGVVPFLIGDAMKIVAATTMVTGIRKLSR
jgi:biotin transport system substrate-specific component